MLFSNDYAHNAERLDALLGTERCYDVISRDLYAGRRRCRVYTIDGYGDDAVIERILAHLMDLTSTVEAQTMQEFVDRYVSFGEVDVENDLEQAVTGVFLGKTLLLADGFAECALIDAKQFPARSVDEPSSGKVLRGAHDGFIETLVVNTALLRRRIRDPHLTLEGHQISEKSRADVVLCYLEHKVDRDLLEEMRRKLAAIDIQSVSMSQESIAEALMKPQWWNPFPSVRYTERPDVATACIMEGSIIVLVDNSPAAMILPTCFFDFVQEANDFYFPPLIGSYLRILRYVVFALTLFITPVWYAIVKTGGTQGALHFLDIAEEYEVPLLAQLLFAEFIVDLIKLTSLNTPPVFSNSFSMIGALVLGDFAVQAHWLVPEVLAYMAFVAIANFAQPSYELGYTFKLLRLMLLLFVAALDWLGLALGCAAIVALLATNKPIAGKSYLYPLIPFNAKAMRELLTRRPIGKANT
ncbi:MAG: spore germination protein [Oscillospiraceae bacterium]|nr:spore germination protein [Oscillospiraceae bacterium]